MTRKKLPIGIQTFAKIRDGEHYYVDKTPFAVKLVEDGTHYFLSRPRRFGKSLLLDSLAELFSGHEPLFRGLYCHDKWDWSRRHPVIRLSFAEGVLQTRLELDEKIGEILGTNQRRLGVDCHNKSLSGCFSELIQLAHERFGQRAVVLVDEYDKPILDNLTNPEVARQMRDGLRNLYSVIKNSDAHIRFAFLTGVSNRIFLFEFKVVELTPDGRALAQLRERAYEDKYRACGEPIHLIGVEFNKATRSVVGFEVERA